MRRRVLVAVGALVGGCVDTRAAPERGIPAKIEALSSLPATSAVGALAGNTVVKVMDASARALSGVVVSFTLSLGNGTLSRATDTTHADGTASSAFTLGTAPARNEVSATVHGVAPVKFAVTGVPGSTSTFSFSRTSIRLPVGTDTSVVTSLARDAFGNATGAAVSWTLRDPTIVSVAPTTNNAFVFRVLRRPGQTYAAANSGSAADSILISVPDASTPCTFGAAPVALSLGGALYVDAGAACIRSSAPGSEYALVVNYNTAVTNVSTALGITGIGISAPVAAPNFARAIVSL